MSYYLPSMIREPLQTGGVFGIKAGDVQSAAILGFKAAGFCPANRLDGGEPHQATIMLVDPAFEALFQDRCAVSLATDANAAVAQSDVVITATPTPSPCST